MEFHPLRPGAREVFAPKPTIQSAINRSFKQLAKTCSRSFKRMEIALRTISADFTTWLSISVGSLGRSSQNEHGLKSAAKAKERSLPTNMLPSSLQKRIQSAAPTTNCSTKPGLRKLMQQISPLQTLIGTTAFLFIVGKSSGYSASRVG